MVGESYGQKTHLSGKNNGREKGKRRTRKHGITPLMYLYNGGESSFITTRDSLEYSRRCFRLTLACCYATHATISRTNGGGGGRACFPRARRFSLSFKSRRSNHEARKIIRVRTSATRGWNTARKKKSKGRKRKT